MNWRLVLTSRISIAIDVLLNAAAKVAYFFEICKFFFVFLAFWAIMDCVNSKKAYIQKQTRIHYKNEQRTFLFQQKFPNIVQIFFL